jgi:hypothetical protein
MDEGPEYASVELIPFRGALPAVGGSLTHKAARTPRGQL